MLGATTKIEWWKLFYGEITVSSSNVSNGIEEAISMSRAFKNDFYIAMYDFLQFMTFTEIAKGVYTC